jgi:predicted Rossmann fold flavoprotein
VNPDVIIIGAGAAGLFCALTAGQRGRRVLVIEHATQVGKKILISGGGRCNFTNRYAAPENYLSANRHFHKAALSRYQPQDFIRLVERHGIRYHEKKLGQLFCDDSAQQIVNLLLNECAAAQATIRTACQVQAVNQITDGFEVVTNQGSFASRAVVIATGGLSIPQMGATDFGYRIARQFGLRIEPPRPALVPFTLNEADRTRFAPLSGISVESTVSFAKASFRENLLVTHKGLSGPAILQISSYWQAGQAVAVNLLPDTDALTWLTAERSNQKELKTLLAQHWPQRFAQAWAAAYAPAKPLNQFSNQELQQLAAQLNRWQLTPDGTEGFRKAEVTAGGVSTDELSSKTMEARRAPGLYFIGEAVDVTGWLGGYNFQWAWASGFAAGTSV